jgi:hypothetical protein
MVTSGSIQETVTIHETMASPASNGTMKRMLWTVGGFCAAAACFLVLGPKLTENVDLLTLPDEDRTEDDTLVELD